MQHFQQRFSPVRLAIFSFVAINLSVAFNKIDQSGSALAQDQVAAQPSPIQSKPIPSNPTRPNPTESSLNTEIKAQDSNTNQANKAVLPNQVATVFNPEIKEIYTANFLPKLPPQPAAQTTFIVGTATKPPQVEVSQPTVNQNLNLLAEKSKTESDIVTDPVPKVESIKSTDKSIETSSAIPSPNSPAIAPTIDNPAPEPLSQLPRLEPIKPAPIKAPVVPTSEPVVPLPEPSKPEPVKVESAPKLEPTISTPAPEVQKNELTPVPPKATDKTTTETTQSPKSPAIAPGTNPAKRVNASNSTVFDTGIRQTPALTIPTVPSQVKLDRTQAITLKEALQIAETNSQVIKQAAIAVQRARAVVEEAVAVRNPNVDVEGRYSFSDSADARQGNIARSPLFADDSTITQPLSGTIQLSYNVFTSGLNEAQIKAAEERLRAAEADLTRVRQSTFLDITNAYIDLQDTDETVRIRAASVNARQLSLKDTQSLERAGVGTKFDVLQSEVQLSNAEQQLLSAQNNQQVRRRALAQQLQYPPTLNLSAADKIEPAPDWKLTLEDTILQALRNRSELDIQKLTASAALNQAKAEIARLGPQVQLTASYDLRDNFSNVGGISMGYTLGARVSWRLFDGGVAGARVKQFESDRDLAESRFEQSATQIRLEVESAYLSLDSTRDQIKTSAKAVLSAAEALRLARLRLTAGVGTQLEVIRAEEDLTQAEVNRSAAVIGFNRAVAALQRSLNTVSPR